MNQDMRGGQATSGRLLPATDLDETRPEDPAPRPAEAPPVTTAPTERPATTTLVELDPRLIQLGVGGLVMVEYVLRRLGASGAPEPAGPRLALVGVLAFTGVCCLVPWRRFPRRAVLLLPLVDLALVGLSRLDPGGSGVGLVSPLLAVWIGWQLAPQLAAGVAGLASLAFLTVPSTLYVGGTEGPNLARNILFVPIAAVTAGVVALAVTRLRLNQERARRDGARLVEALAQVREERSFATAIFDSVDVGLVLLDARGRYRALNRHHQALMDLAYPGGHAGVAGQTGHVFEADAVTPVVREAMPTYLASHGQEFDDRRIWIGEDPAARLCLSVSARIVHDDDGGVAGAALAYKDVTEIMRMERVKDEFLASVSHELRTPLTSISGYLALVLEDDPALPDQTRRHLEVAARNATRLHRLVADLLSAGPGEGGLTIVPVLTQVSGMVEDAVATAVDGTRGAGVEVATHVEPALSAEVDGGRLAQVVENLVSNAVKFTPRGGRVDVGLRLDGECLLLEVADTGIGMDAEEQAQLFTDFFRSDHARRQSIPGVGLGLAIVARIVEGHGGLIDVDSAPGRGSTFSVRLPVRAGQPLRAD